MKQDIICKTNYLSVAWQGKCLPIGGKANNFLHIEV